MIIGIGCDLCNISRIEKIIEKSQQAFIQRILSPQEIKYFESRNISTLKQKSAYLAKRFAAKEACAKAIGTGFAKGILWKDIQIINNELGKPELIIAGESLLNLQKRHQDKELSFQLSLSDDYPWAQAFVVIETS